MYFYLNSMQKLKIKAISKKEDHARKKKVTIEKTHKTETFSEEEKPVKKKKGKKTKIEPKKKSISKIDFI